MGGVKNEWIEAESRGYRLPDEKFICASHFDDIYLKEYIKEFSSLGICDYCGKSKLVVDLRDFIEYVAGKITEHFTNFDNGDLPLANGFFDDDDESIPGLQRVGCFVAPSSAETFESTKELLFDIDLISDNEDLNNDIEDCFMWDEWIQASPFVLTKRQELSFMWETFSRMVKHEQRFTFFKREEFTKDSFSEDNGLMDILSELGEKITKHKLYKTLNKDEILYRCRFIGEGEVVDTFEKITSPPDNIAKQSRMSPAGISMFYGAFDKETAILESSPLGDGLGTHIVGKFAIKKELRLLDLTSLPIQSFWITNDWEEIAFLHSFNREITKPIDRNGSIHIEYIPSQVFTEYLRYIYKTSDGFNINGIIYGSSLSRKEKNIVLFYNQKSSKEILELEGFE
ncbi:HEPN-associated N-terminal domain-containing protein [Bacteroides nordii]|uniref:HEPN-associated N-terminal domain-containing protein n=1 Tax=Bacteroides nordii TaxID=291645 RepID=UPI0039B6200E